MAIFSLNIFSETHYSDIDIIEIKIKKKAHNTSVLHIGNLKHNNLSNIYFSIFLNYTKKELKTKITF